MDALTRQMYLMTSLVKKVTRFDQIQQDFVDDVHFVSAYDALQQG